jgi:Tfp pilus assembly protein PilO
MHVIDDNTRRFGRLLHYAGLLATVACAASGYSLVHAPAIEHVAATSAQIEELRLSVKNAPIAREHHQKVSAKLFAVRDRIAAIQRRVPQDAEAGTFLKAVTELATQEQLAIKDFHPEKPTSRNGFAEMQVTLKGIGSYASICKFLDRLSKLTRLSKVKDLTLSAADDAGQYPMTATLVIYFGLQGKDLESGGPGPSQSGLEYRHKSARFAHVVRGSPDPTQIVHVPGDSDPPGSVKRSATTRRSVTTQPQEGRRG